MGPSADHPFPYPPPSENNLALAQAPFSTRELESQGSRILFIQSPILEIRYGYGSLLTGACYI
jgi:hypothetical protein